MLFSRGWQGRSVQELVVASLSATSAVNVQFGGRGSWQYKSLCIYSLQLTVSQHVLHSRHRMPLRKIYEVRFFNATTYVHSSVHKEQVGRVRRASG
ncbi:hypothetical protein BDQ12DRAFT_672271 [Crucibulum laeve]|uniref:Uncharacterized protein n=1 Tax=Crucibulum laeve TaxID=68775 RepID=A0A5C3MRT5_9AGAR|nr:hypothetical protein BDQ12DRAFT_672271 [Crucibulum laeve]